MKTAPNMHYQYMTLGNLRRILSELANELEENTEVWISCDEEGNEFFPMPAKEDLSIGVDKNPPKIVFFPAHR